MSETSEVGDIRATRFPEWARELLLLVTGAVLALIGGVVSSVIGNVGYADAWQAADLREQRLDAYSGFAAKLTEVEQTGSVVIEGVGSDDGQAMATLDLVYGELATGYARLQIIGSTEARAAADVVFGHAFEYVQAIREAVERFAAGGSEDEAAVARTYLGFVGLCLHPEVSGSYLAAVQADLGTDSSGIDPIPECEALDWGDLLAGLDG